MADPNPTENLTHSSRYSGNFMFDFDDDDEEIKQAEEYRFSLTEEGVKASGLESELTPRSINLRQAITPGPLLAEKCLTGTFANIWS